MNLIDILSALQIEPEFNSQLGGGRFSIVFPGRYRGNNGKPVAIKICAPKINPAPHKNTTNKYCSSLKYGGDVFKRDIEIQETLCLKIGDNVIQVYDSHLNRQFPNFAILERGSELTLEGLIENSQDFSLPSKIKVIEDIASAIYAVHQQGYVHNDIKPGNIIFEMGAKIKADTNKNLLCEIMGKPKLTDFGAARLRGERIRQILGTPQYISPDILTEDRFDVYFDIYSLGVIAYELLSFNQFPSRIKLAKSGNSCLILPTNVPLNLIWPPSFYQKGHQKLIESVNRMVSTKPASSRQEDKRYSSMREVIKDLQEARELLEKSGTYY
ncbi:MAG: protein kinase [Candidatus Pacearchaeota archaeon]|nr:protein kinase [Candidatus Pacearchaeota archaeon]